MGGLSNLQLQVHFDTALLVTWYTLSPVTLRHPSGVYPLLIELIQLGEIVSDSKSIGTLSLPNFAHTSNMHRQEKTCTQAD